jgi:hypothetical protein
MRSGTTSLTRYLDDHPEVFMAKPKEVGYFLHEYHRGERWYLSHFENSSSATKVGEGTPAYMVSQLAIDRIKATIPEAVLIAVLREPVRRAYSHYWMRRARGRENEEFGKVVELELQRSSLIEEGNVGYLGHSLYVHHVRRMLEAFPGGRVHIVILEELRSNPERLYRDLCRVLDVDPEHLPESLGVPVNKYVTFRSRRLRRVAHMLPNPLRRGIDLLNTRKGAPYPAVDPRIAADLADFFSPFNRELEALIGRPIYEWRTTDRN